MDNLPQRGIVSRIECSFEGSARRPRAHGTTGPAIQKSCRSIAPQADEDDLFVDGLEAGQGRAWQGGDRLVIAPKVAVDEDAQIVDSLELDKAEGHHCALGDLLWCELEDLSPGV